MISTSKSKKLCTMLQLIIISMGFMACSSTGSFHTWNELQLRETILTDGSGAIHVSSSHTMYFSRTVLKTRMVHNPGLKNNGINSNGHPSIHTTPLAYSEITYIPMPVDRSLRFQVLKGDELIFDGRTPVTVENLSPNIEYTLRWNGISGQRREMPFIFP